MYVRKFLRTLPAGTKFVQADDGTFTEYTVVAPGTFTVSCRDSTFNLVWELKGSAIVNVKEPAFR